MPTLLSTYENCKWFQLEGDTRRAAVRTLYLGGIENADPGEQKRLMKALGQDFEVCRYDVVHGHAAVFPYIFKAGFILGHEEVFFMACPVGRREDGQTHFTPREGQVQNEDDIQDLKQSLFQPGGGSVPVIARRPIAYANQNLLPAPERS